MPFIHAKFSCDVTPQQEENIKTKLGKAISVLSGKSESYLMVQIEGNCHLYFQGNNEENSAIFEVSVFGSASKHDYVKLTGELCDIAFDELSIQSNRTYVKFMETDNWGYDSFMF